VLVKTKSTEEKTSGGIFLPSTVQTKPQGGEVIAVGQGRTVGDKKVGVSVQVILWCTLFIYLFLLMEGSICIIFTLGTRVGIVLNDMYACVPERRYISFLAFVVML
jgi:Chaperonin 10 Kd subunit